MIHLREKNATEYTSLEQHFNNMVWDKAGDLFPVHKSLALAGKDAEEADKGKMLARVLELVQEQARLQHGLAAEVRAIRKTVASAGAAAGKGRAKAAGTAATGAAAAKAGTTPRRSWQRLTAAAMQRPTPQAEPDVLA